MAISSNPKISIITPSYNQGEFIEQTIQSVLDQGYDNLEYIIIDGGSSDKSPQIIKKYEKHLKYWVSEKDLGQSHAINKGFAQATGEVINWLNSDDYYAANTLQLIGEYFKDKELNVLCGKSNLLHSNGREHEISHGTRIFKDNLGKSSGILRIDQPETFFRKSCFDNIGYLNDSLHYIMDKELWLRYLLHYGQENVLMVDDIFANFRFHEDSKTVSQSENFSNEQIMMFASVAEFGGLKKEAEDLLSLTSDPSKRLTLEGYKGVKEADIISALQYQLLYLIDYYYYYAQFAKAKLLISHIDTTLLDKTAKKTFKSLTLKLRFIPEALYKKIRGLND